MLGGQGFSPEELAAAERHLEQSQVHAQHLHTSHKYIKKVR